MTLEDLIETFQALPEWEDRYRALIEMGRALPPYPNDRLTEENKVRGCMSQVWMAVKTSDPFDFWVESDSSLVKGLAAILHMAYAGKPRSGISAVDVQDIFKRLDLENHISPNRRNGFFSMVERIKSLPVE
jgi:cysteine desulfuration protein SufE